MNTNEIPDDVKVFMDKITPLFKPVTKHVTQKEIIEWSRKQRALKKK